MKKIIKKILHKYGYDISTYPVVITNVRQMKNFSYFSKMYEKIDNVSGSVVECGVGKGRSLLYFSFLSQREKKGRKVWGFDSFEGFPEPDEKDKSSRNPKKGEWSGVDVYYIKKLLRNSGVQKDFIENNIRLIKGFFDKSLTEYDKKPIALLHIDVDLYQSYIDVLEQLFPFVSEGGIVLFDEYGEDNWPGAKKAVDEFFAKTAYKILQDKDSGKHYVIKR